MTDPQTPKSKRDYDSTIARIAGNIASGFASRPDLNCSPYASTEQISGWVRSVSLLSVGLAVEIVKLCREAARNEAPDV